MRPRQSWLGPEDCSFRFAVELGEKFLYIAVEVTDERPVYKQAVAWQQEMGMSPAGFSLNNGGDFVQLLRIYEGPEGPEYELMFSISYDDHEAEDDRSCGFNTEMSNWILFDGMNPYGGDQDPVGTGCSPSPSDPNTCQGNVPVQASSFGEVKAVYR